MLRMIYIAAALLIVSATLFMGDRFGLSGEDASAVVTPRTVFMGELAVYKITALCNSDTQIALPDIRKDLAGVTILKEGSSEATFLWRKRRVAWWLFAVDRIGDYVIPPVRIIFVDPSQTKREVRTSAAIAVVKSMTGLSGVSFNKVRVDAGMPSGAGSMSGRSGGFETVDGPIRIRIEDQPPPLSIFDREKALISAGAGVTGLIVAYLVFLAWSKRPPKKRYIPPERIFLARLGKLEKKLPAAKGELREPYYELSSALREYLKSILDVSARELTTKELIDSIIKSEVVTSGNKTICAELLAAFDEVKYSAESASDSAKLANCINAARRLAETDPDAKTASEGA